MGRLRLRDKGLLVTDVGSVPCLVRSQHASLSTTLPPPLTAHIYGCLLCATMILISQIGVGGITEAQRGEGACPSSHSWEEMRGRGPRCV